MQMILELALGDEKQHHQVDGYAIQRLELNPFARTTDCSDDIRN